MKKHRHDVSAVVLHVRDVGESHRVVDLLTDKLGRVRALARGARSSKKRFAGVLDLFTSLRVQLTEQTSGWILESAELEKPRLEIRRNLRTLDSAMTFVESFTLLVHENQTNHAAYVLANAGLDLLAADQLPKMGMVWRRMLELSGIQPDLSHCGQCHNTGPIIGLHVQGGYGLCATCSPRSGKAMSKYVYDVLAGGECVDSETATAVEQVVVDWLQGQLGKHFSSRRVLLSTTAA